MKDIVIYGSTTCGHCENLKVFLKSKNLDFQDFNVMKDSDAMDKVLALGAKKLPVLVYNDQFVSGFNEDKIREVLGI